MEQKKTPKDYEVFFHVTPRCEKSAKKSRHHVSHSLEKIKLVLKQYPEYGTVIPGHNKLRKMRVAVPGMGKSGGYRLIYRKTEGEEIIYITFLEVYFKGYISDLSNDEYRILTAESEEVLKNILEIDWEKQAPPEDDNR
ncbi:MAG: hypothetical protein HY537_12570 [Deltaproteobacteria bacterium]|nr:hypothetical protein [Deltaproteobacteria bacterium]